MRAFAEALGGGGDVAAFGQVLERGEAAGEEAEEAFCDGGFAGAADADEGADASGGGFPPVAELGELGAVLPVACGEERVDEGGLGRGVGHNVSAWFCATETRRG